jgi:putative hemolysin
MQHDPFALDEVPAPARWLLDRVLALPEYRRLYARVGCDRGPFERRVLRALDITSDVSPDDLLALPRRGAVIVAANHPHGLLDGLVLADLLRRVRPDVRVLMNHLLARIPELRDLAFFVDPFDGPRAAARSRAGLRDAHLWLRAGGALVVFPSGAVAHRFERGAVRDEAWKPTIARLAAATGARVVPAWIDGANSRMFRAAGRIHPALRTALLGREFLKSRGRRIAVRLGEPIAATPGDAPHPSGSGLLETVRGAVEALADPVAAEVRRLPASARLVSSGAFEVYCADASQVPATLEEIGRLREIAYRAVGEGTGRRLDVDAFDQRYLHLFLWDRNACAVVGAYRIGRTDEIAAAHGVEGLYTRTLFRYDRELLDRLGAPALELGRSFVRLEYQKHHSALLLLWRGIGRFVARHPSYRLLFGPVSISARYSDTSHRLLTTFLRQNHLHRDLAQLVAAVHPHQAPAPDAATLVPQTMKDVERLVAEVDGTGVPVLLRQYLKLNARLLGFNVDPAFGDALDALMVVDLTKVDRAILYRYLGRDDAERFLAFHGPRESKSAA